MSVIKLPLLDLLYFLDFLSSTEPKYIDDPAIAPSLSFAEENFYYSK